jgi:hypothetical protein
MMNSRAARAFVVILLGQAIYLQANGQETRASGTRDRHLLSLDFTNNGQSVRTAVGQQIEITLGSVGPAQYGAPLVSSSAVRLESTALQWPPNPGGATFVYIFSAAEVGEAQVIVPLLNSEDPEVARNNTFAVTFRVGPAPGKPRATSRPDQANTAKSTTAWTNLLNNAQQTFTPALPILTAVEVELVVANAGPSDDELTLSLLNPEGEVLAVISKTVSSENCAHVRFYFPGGGLPVSLGQVYTIQLKGDSLFGWKYIARGYPNGAALMNGKALVADARTSFLFQTFGVK